MREDAQLLVELYEIALEQEKVFYAAVKGKGPGQPGHDPAAFREWLDAVGRTNQASRLMREALSGQPNPA